MSACSTKSTTSPSEGKMERNLSNPWGPHHIRTWVPIFTPAHLRTWPTVYLYPGNREGQPGVQSCQQPSETPKLVRLMWTIPVSQSQSMVPWTVRRNYWPSCYRSEDPNVTAMSEAVRAQLGITEPLPKPALASPSSGLSTLADDLKRSRVSRLLPEVTCPSPFHPRTRTVAIAELQDVPVTETEIKGLKALAALAGRPPPLQTQPQGAGRVANQLPRRTSSWSCRSWTLKTCLKGQRNLPSLFYSPANLMRMWPLNVPFSNAHAKRNFCKNQ